MKFAKTTAIGVVLALGVTAGSPALARKKEDTAAQPAGPTYSKEFRQAAQPLQKAMAAGDYAAAKAALPAAQAAASTDDDKYEAALMALQIGLKTNDTAAEKTNADLVINSGKAPQKTLVEILDLRARLAYNEQDFATADADLTKLLQLTPDNTDDLTLLAAVKAREGKGTDGLPLIDQAIKAQQAAGKAPDEDTIRRALSIAYDAKMPAETAKYGELLVKDYPTPETWHIALATYRDNAHLSPASNLDLLRLMRVTHSLAGEQDYYDYANSALNSGFPGEAKAVLDEGMSASQVDPKVKASKNLAELRQMSGTKVAADKAALPAQDKKAMAGSGTLALNTADAHYGYGEFAQAVPLYKAALQKGGVDANTVNLHMGMALAQAGQKAAADQAFQAVTGPASDLAQYWMIWNDHQAA